MAHLGLFFALGNHERALKMWQSGHIGCLKLVAETSLVSQRRSCSVFYVHLFRSRATNGGRKGSDFGKISFGDLDTSKDPTQAGTAKLSCLDIPEVK